LAIAPLTLFLVIGITGASRHGRAETFVVAKPGTIDTSTVAGVTLAPGADPGGTDTIALAQATPHPAATPAAPGCGNEASSPTEVAEVFLAAATAQSLERAAPCFAPESQPQRWDEVFLGGDEDGWDDVSGCQGRPYVVTESKIRAGFSAIIFAFDQACAIAQLDPWQGQIYDAETLSVTTVVVQTYRADDRWYVLDAFAVVAD
jgi:hypothetical protein